MDQCSPLMFVSCSALIVIPVQSSIRRGGILNDIFTAGLHNTHPRLRRKALSEPLMTVDHVIHVPHATDLQTRIATISILIERRTLLCPYSIALIFVRRWTMRKQRANNSKCHILQFCSSDISPQSLSPSQTQDPLTQRPVSHWNWSSRHAEQSHQKHS